MPTMRPWLLAAAAYLALAGFLAETRLELADLRRESGATYSYQQSCSYAPA